MGKIHESQCGLTVDHISTLNALKVVTEIASFSTQQLLIQ